MSASWREVMQRDTKRFLRIDHMQSSPLQYLHHVWRFRKVGTFFLHYFEPPSCLGLRHFLNFPLMLSCLEPVSGVWVEFYLANLDGFAPSELVGSGSSRVLP